ncbi:unnamed protein product [Meloidogyne enterolobii]|uniref:Uncharacterized protein n=1 Tax=Meloidogyne enterolobii TaxID=390850 RepID=A0ACB1AH78_MELEN
MTYFLFKLGGLDVTKKFFYLKTDENGESNIIKYYPKVCKISYSCKFKIDWSDVLQLEINKVEKKNQIEEDDPDSLL